jgi:predicted transcriptional regulator
MATTRERLHALLDDVPEDRLDDVEAALVDATAPYRPLEDAPEDDEPVTAEDLAAILEGRAAYARGESIPHEKAMRKIGLR